MREKQKMSKEKLKELQKAGELLIRNTLKIPGKSERNEAGSGLLNLKSFS